MKLDIEGNFRDNIVGDNWELSGEFDMPASAVALSLSKEGIALDEKLRRKLPPINVGPFSELEALDGLANLGFNLSYGPAPKTTLHCRFGMDLLKCRARVTGFPYTLDSIIGGLEFKDGRLKLDNIAVKSQSISATAEGFLCPDGEADV